MLRVAVPQDLPPSGRVGADVAPLGYDVDTANLIGEAIGVKVELAPVTSANRIADLQTSKVDLVISSLCKNEEREKVIDFSEACAPFFKGVFTPASKIASAADLSKKTVGVLRGAIEDLALLCDEITSALDPELVQEVLAVVRELASEGTTLIMVTHEMRFAPDVCSRVVFMHQGRVLEIGTPGEVFANPSTPELRQFLGAH